MILEENPKWGLLLQTLEEIEKCNIPDPKSILIYLISFFIFIFIFIFLKKKN